MWVLVRRGPWGRARVWGDLGDKLMDERKVFKPLVWVCIHMYRIGWCVGWCFSIYCTLIRLTSRGKMAKNEWDERW